MTGKKLAQIARISPEQLAKNLNVRFKGTVVQMASKIVDTKIVKRPTGIPSLDIALGGGFPGGTICAISGKESVGKDALLNRIMRTHQRIYGPDSSIFYAATEVGGFDKLWARAHGVRVALSDEDIRDYEAALGEKLDHDTIVRLRQQVGSFTLVPSSAAEEVFTSTLSYGDTGAAHLLIINSINALLPEIDLDNPDVEPSGSEGLRQAKLVTDFTKKWGKVVTDQKYSRRPWYPTLIVTQQARANLGGGPSFAKKLTTTNTGAHALRHAKSIDVELNFAEKLLDRDESIGKKVRWNLVKGKHGTHDGIQGLYDLYYTSGPDECEDIVAALCNHDFLKIGKEKDLTALRDFGAVGVGEVFSKPDLITKFRSDQELFDAAYKLLLKTAVKAPYLVMEPQ